MRTNIEYLVDIRGKLQQSEYSIDAEIRSLRTEIMSKRYDDEERKELYKKNGELHHRRQAIRGQLDLLSHLLNYDSPLNTDGRIIIHSERFEY